MLENLLGDTIERPLRCRNIQGHEQTEKESTMSELITCSWCNLPKLSTQFTFENKAKNLKKRFCQDCDRARQHTYYNKNRTELLAKKQEYYAANPIPHLQKSANYRKQHPEKIKQGLKDWANNNPEKIKANSKKRKAVIRGAEAKAITSKEIAKLLAQNCFYCGSSKDIQIDHIFPISRGGKHQIGNLVSACQKCNNSKNKWFITEWQLMQKKRTQWS
jgi:5-methylcytosine-specific restriction endonuclease McrA